MCERLDQSLLALKLEGSHELKNGSSHWKLEKEENRVSPKSSIKESSLADTLILASETLFEFVVICSAAIGNKW